MRSPSGAAPLVLSLLFVASDAPPGDASDALRIGVVTIDGPGVCGHRRGASFDLGSVFQFLLAVDAGYRLDGGSVVGVSLAHFSNADLYARNPGVEALMLFVTLPRL